MRVRVKFGTCHVVVQLMRDKIDRIAIDSKDDYRLILLITDHLDTINKQFIGLLI